MAAAANRDHRREPGEVAGDVPLQSLELVRLDLQGQIRELLVGAHKARERTRPATPARNAAAASCIAMRPKRVEPPFANPWISPGSRTNRPVSRSAFNPLPGGPRPSARPGAAATRSPPSA